MDLELSLKNKKLTDIELELIHYIVSEIEYLEGVGIREIASKHYTSPATVVRMSKKLGFTGYVELYHYIKNHSEHAENSRKSVIVDYQIDDIKISEHAQKAKEIYQLNNQKLILIYATGFSGIAGEYLSKKLLVNGISVIYLSEKDSVAIIENNVNNISMFVGISKSGETRRLLDKMTYIQQYDIPLVLFTGNEKSQAYEMSDITFLVEDDCKVDGQNREFNGFFGKLLLIIEYFVYHFIK